jgi:hypothetical protein
MIKMMMKMMKMMMMKMMKIMMMMMTMISAFCFKHIPTQTLAPPPFVLGIPWSPGEQKQMLGIPCLSIPYVDRFMHHVGGLLLNNNVVATIE